MNKELYLKFNQLVLEHSPENIPNSWYYGKPSSNWLLAHGLCFYYSYLFSQVFGGQVISYMTKTNGGHCFIKLNNQYYDSENFKINSWKKLQRYMNKSSEKRLIKHSSSKAALKKWKISKSDIAIYDDVVKKIKANL